MSQRSGLLPRARARVGGVSSRRPRPRAHDFILDKLARELAHIAAVTMKRGDDTAKRERAIVVTKEKRRVTVTTKTRGPRWRGFLRHETSGPKMSRGRAKPNPRCRKIP